MTVSHPDMLRTLALLLLLPLHAAIPEPPRASSVAVIYNESIPDSKKLALAYSKARDIPLDNLVGLKLPDKEEINREEYDNLIRDPLATEFDRRSWWTRARDPQGQLQPRESQIRILACMRGVPSRIRHPKIKNADGSGPSQEQQLQTASAAVDSELAMLGVEGYPLNGAINNPYFKETGPIATTQIPILLVGRIDAHSFAVCHRMIEDAVATEKTGLWGFGVVDIANKMPQGDLWLSTAARELNQAGIPTLIDRSSDTLPVNFPLTDTSIYLGWYDWHVSGPFTNPAFSFARGAVAVHLHSFSAQQLRNSGQNWCSPLLARGAAATVGNTYEPFLHLTHHLDILTNRLLEGYSLVEAAYMAAPALSWQNVVIGDPLYRPFMRLDGSGERASKDRLFRAFRIAKLRWPDDPDESELQLRAAAARMEDPRLLEAIGLSLEAGGDSARAGTLFRDAKHRFERQVDKLRMDLYIAMLDRQAKRTASAIQVLRLAEVTYPSIPETKAATAWLNILDPPPPPPAQKNDR